MANRKWIQKVNRGIKKRGTRGAFTEHCGGNVTDKCIEDALNSNNPTLQKQASLAKAFRSIGRKRAQGGEYLEPRNDMQVMQMQMNNPMSAFGPTRQTAGPASPMVPVATEQNDIFLPENINDLVGFGENVVSYPTVPRQQPVQQQAQPVAQPVAQPAAQPQQTVDQQPQQQAVQQQQPVTLPPIGNQEMSNLFLDLNNDGQVNFGQGNVQGGVPISQPQVQQQQQIQKAPAQKGISGGIQPPAQSGYGFGPDPNMQANDNIIAAGKQASGVANMEAAAPKIDSSQVAETITPKLAESGAEVASDAASAAGDAAGGGGMGAGAYAIAGKAMEMGGDAIMKNADDTTGKNVAGQALKTAGKGAAMGASIGTMIMPGIGTAIGAGIGAIGGATVGLVKGKRDQNTSIAERRSSERDKARELLNMRKNATTTVGQNTGFNIGMSTAGSNAYLPGQAASGYAAKYGAYKMKTGGSLSSRLRETAAGKSMEENMQLLPGGVKYPIGFGVEKFEGNKHDQAGMGSDSGIILERGGRGRKGLEVEDGELEVEVMTKDEGEQEYIVSNYIRNPKTGNTLAEDLEKELEAASNKQEAARIVARYVRLNEELKGSQGSPERVAEPGREKAQLGKRKKADKQYEEEMAAYEQAQADREKALEERDRIEAENKAGQEAIDRENALIAAQEAADEKRFADETAEYERITAENARLREEAAGKGAVQERDASGNVIYGGDRSANIASWLGAREAEYGKLPEEFQTYDFNQFKNEAGEFDASKFDIQARSGFRDFYNALPDDLVTGKIRAENDTDDLAFGQQWDTRRLLQRAAAPEAVQGKQEYVQKEFTPADVPDAGPPVGPAPTPPAPRIGGRFTGTMLQSAGPIQALRENYVTETIATPYEKERLLGRVNLNQERARTSAGAAASRAATTSAVAGPAALALQQNIGAQEASTQAGITDQESKANVGIANQETSQNMAVAARNARSFADTQRFNAQMRKMAGDQNVDRRIDAVNQLGRIATQTVKDYNQQFADKFEAQANQVDGEFDRALINYYKPTMPFGIGGTNLYPQGNSTLSPEQIQAMYQQNSQDETAADNTGEARKGGYIKKSRKLTRRKRK